MKIFGIVGLATVLLTTGVVPASALSCDQIADICSSRARSSNNSCYDDSRLKQCRATGVYNAPNGSTFRASKPATVKPASVKKVKQQNR